MWWGTVAERMGPRGTSVVEEVPNSCTGPQATGRLAGLSEDPPQIIRLTAPGPRPPPPTSAMLIITLLFRTERESDDGFPSLSQLAELITRSFLNETSKLHLITAKIVSNMICI